jgi:hypothetical protein
MYEGLTANTPGCVAFSLPVQRRNLRNLGDSSVFPIPPQPAQRAADKERRFRARAACGPRLPSCSRDGFKTRRNRLPRDANVPIAKMRQALWRWPKPAARDKAAFCRPNVLDGPTLDAPDCKADHDPRKNRANAKRELRAPPCSRRIPFGAARRVAFWPSPHPRIRWTVASPGGATRAYRDTRPPPPRVPKCPTKC